MCQQGANLLAKAALSSISVSAGAEQQSKQLLETLPFQLKGVIRLAKLSSFKEIS